MKKWIVILLTSLIGNWALAQTTELEEKRALVKEILVAQGSISRMEKMNVFFGDMMKQQFTKMVREGSPHLNATQQQRAVSAFSDVFTKNFTEISSAMMPSLLSSIETLYTNKFNLDELRELHKFSISPVAKKSFDVVMDEMPTLMAPYMNRINQATQNLRPQMDKVVQDLEKEGIRLSLK